MGNLYSDIWNPHSAFIPRSSWLTLKIRLTAHFTHGIYSCNWNLKLHSSDILWELKKSFSINASEGFFKHIVLYFAYNIPTKYKRSTESWESSFWKAILCGYMDFPTDFGIWATRSWFPDH